MIVADTNLLIAYMIEGPLTPLARKWATVARVWHVPILWRYEFTNAINTYLRSGLLMPSAGPEILKEAIKSFSAHEHATDQLKVLSLALGLNISPYDANFVLLAEELRTYCVTNGKQMLERARRRTRSFGQLPDSE